MNPDDPPDLFAAAYAVAAEWRRAAELTVQAGKFGNTRVPGRERER